MGTELRIGLGKSDTNDEKWGMGTTELGRLAWRQEGGVKPSFLIL